jgi:hypothetical protein
MIKTTAMLVEELNDYVNQTAKIRRLVDCGELVPIVRGLYETDLHTPGHYLAPAIFGPSYLSFEFALSYHSLIPEAVYTFTSACFEKKKAKRYETPFGTYTYRDVPGEAYPVGIILFSESGYGFQIATPEKAICDELYKLPPLKNRAELERLLFDDLRIDQDEFFRLNMADLFEIATLYHTQNHKLLRAFAKRRMKNGSNH